MAEQSKQVKGIKVDKVLVVPSAEARGFRSREALLQASKHGDALLKRGRRLQQARYPRRRTPMLDDPELRRLNVSAEQYAAVEQRVIDRLAGEAGCNPYDPHASEYDRQRHIAWEEGAACGVAAERAQAAKLREALRILSDPDDPPFADWAFFDRAEDREEASQAFARAALAADLLASSTAEKLASPRKHSASASDPMPLCDCEFCARPLRDHDEEESG